MCESPSLCCALSFGALFGTLRTSQLLQQFPYATGSPAPLLNPQQPPFDCLRLRPCVRRRHLALLMLILFLYKFAIRCQQRRRRHRTFLCWNTYISCRSCCYCYCCCCACCCCCRCPTVGSVIAIVLFLPLAVSIGARRPIGEQMTRSATNGGAAWCE